MNMYVSIVSLSLIPEVLHTFPLVPHDVHQGNKISLGSVHRCQQVQLSSSDDPLRTRPKPGEQYLLECIHLRHIGLNRGIFGWGAISYNLRPNSLFF